MKGCFSSPNKSIHKMLSKRFSVIEIDEFRTSIRYNKDPTQELKNYKAKRKNRKRKSVHSLLTLKRDPNSVILNRDINASKNILCLLKTYLKDQTRPEAFSRSVLVPSVVGN